MRERTPDQIRQETVPMKHNGLIYGFLGGLLGAVIWFGGWAMFHQNQLRRYPAYCAYAVQSSLGQLNLFGARPKPAMGLSADQLRYALLRYGNQNHRFDAEIIRHRWYPREASPAAWVYYNGAIKPTYSDSPAMVFKWPLTLTLLTFLAFLIYGLVADYRYKSSIISGIPFDGSIVATIQDYNREVKGDGMKYRVKSWQDR